MIVTETKLKGAFIIDVERLEDQRGFFARSWSQPEMRAHGVGVSFVESNISFNRKKGTLRGMHFQSAPRAQAKLVRCTMGAIYDVAIDLRPASPTFRQWVGVELTAENRRQFFIPEGFAHGFQTIEENTELFYQVSDYYTPELSGGVRWNDPAFAVEWPHAARTIVARDEQYPDFAQ